MRTPLFSRFRVRPAADRLLASIATAMFVIACHRAPGSPPTPSSAARPENRAAASTVPNLPPGFTALQVAEGDSLFNHTSCWRCHGMDARGSANGPTFRRGVWQHGDGSVGAIAHTIEVGVPPTEIKDTTFELQMNPNPSRFTPSQIRSVAAYIWTVSRARDVKK
jgi:mono/diheme cytochrome c family protein